MFESKRRALIFIILSFILAAIGGILFYNTVKDLNADLGQMTEVYISNSNIPSREVINSTEVTTMKIPNRFVTDGHILSLEEFEDKISIIPLNVGDIITHNMLRPFSSVTDEGNRLVEMLIEWGNIHFDQKIEALDRVDIVVSHNFKEDPTTEIFMTDVLVATVSTGEEGFEGVTLEIPLLEAPLLIHMQNYADNIRILKSNSGMKVDIKQTGENAEEKSIDVQEDEDQG